MSDDNAIFELDQYIKEHGEPSVKSPFTTEITQEEADAGFREMALKNQNRYAFEPSHHRAVVRDLGNGKLAVKTEVESSVSYAIWDQKSLQPVDQPALSIESLLARFP